MRRNHGRGGRREELGKVKDAEGEGKRVREGARV